MQTRRRTNNHNIRPLGWRLAVESIVGRAVVPWLLHDSCPTPQLPGARVPGCPDPAIDPRVWGSAAPPQLLPYAPCAGWCAVVNTIYSTRSHTFRWRIILLACLRCTGMRSLDFDDSKQNQQSLGGTGTLYGLQSILCSTPSCPALPTTF